MKMTEQEARKLAIVALSDSNSPVTDVAYAILTACTAEAADCEARVQAERERCAETVESLELSANQAADGDYVLGISDSAKRIRSLGPTDTLEAKLREARMIEAEWWHRMWQGCEFERHVCDPDNHICQRLSALKGATEIRALPDEGGKVVE